MAVYIRAEIVEAREEMRERSREATERVKAAAEKMRADLDRVNNKGGQQVMEPRPVPDESQQFCDHSDTPDGTGLLRLVSVCDVYKGKRQAAIGEEYARRMGYEVRVNRGPHRRTDCIVTRPQPRRRPNDTRLSRMIGVGGIDSNRYRTWSAGCPVLATMFCTTTPTAATRPRSKRRPY